MSSSERANSHTTHKITQNLNLFPENISIACNLCILPNVYYLWESLWELSEKNFSEQMFPVTLMSL